MERAKEMERARTRAVADIFGMAANLGGFMAVVFVTPVSAGGSISPAFSSLTSAPGVSTNPGQVAGLVDLLTAQSMQKLAAMAPKPPAQAAQTAAKTVAALATSAKKKTAKKKTAKKT